MTGNRLTKLQHRAVDAIKRHALSLSTDSRAAEARVLTEYLWSEEGAEAVALDRVASGAPPWLTKLARNQLADEARHAELLRDRLDDLGATERPPPPAIARVKLWWLERTCRRYADRFAAGPLVGVLAVAAQLESTGVRMFDRHLGVLEAADPDGPTAEVLRSILADEKRHARSCSAAVERLVSDDERADLEALRARIARIDRAFGVTISLAFWLVVAAHVAVDRRGRSA